MIAKVVVENAAYSFDIAFSYQVPPAMQEDIRPRVSGADPVWKVQSGAPGTGDVAGRRGRIKTQTHPDAVGLKTTA